MFHFLTKQSYSKYSQISMSMLFSSSEASTMFRSSTASSTSESVIFSKWLSLFLSSRTDNCNFSCWRPAWQGSFGLKQWILSSSDPSFARFSAHDLNDSGLSPPLKELPIILISTERSFSLAAASCYQPQCIDAHFQPSSDNISYQWTLWKVCSNIRQGLEYTLYILQEQSLDRSYIVWHSKESQDSKRRPNEIFQEPFLPILVLTLHSSRRFLMKLQHSDF